MIADRARRDRLFLAGEVLAIFERFRSPALGETGPSMQRN
jgi:hypothetical protein